MLIIAEGLKVGDQLAEHDGFLWDVTEIVKVTEKMITVKLHSDFSNYKKHWKTGPGVTKTFRKSSRLFGVVS